MMTLEELYEGTEKRINMRKTEIAILVNQVNKSIDMIEISSLMMELSFKKGGLADLETLMVVLEEMING